LSKKAYDAYMAFQEARLVDPRTGKSYPKPSGEVRVVDPITGGMKGSKPERFDLLPWPALEEVARVYAFGATKYDDHNWHKPSGARGIPLPHPHYIPT
jgi:hypothetical protein